jgi:hypothetical protein
VGQLVANNLIAQAHIGLYGNLIGHGTAREKETCFHAKQGSYAVLQCIDGGVISKDIITYGCGVHGFFHGGCGAGNSVAAQIYGHT